ncbi:MAG: hypothetical protein ACPGRD_10105 [Planktomarina sp.]
MNPMWFMRVARMARNPPSKKRVMIVLGVIAICAVILGIEQFIGWPEFLTGNNWKGGRLGNTPLN